MASFKFSFVVRLEHHDLDSLAAAFYEHFEGEVARQGGSVQVAVYCDGDDAQQVARDSVRALEHRLGIRVESLDLDLVDIPEIAARTGRSRQSIQQLATGKRHSEGDFPTPIGAPGGKRIWEWAVVNEWLRVHLPDRADDEAGLTRDEARLLDAWLVRRRSAQPIEALRLEFEAHVGQSGVSRRDWSVVGAGNLRTLRISAADQGDLLVPAASTWAADSSMVIGA